MNPLDATAGGVQFGQPFLLVAAVLLPLLLAVAVAYARRRRAAARARLGGPPSLQSGGREARRAAAATLAILAVAAAVVAGARPQWGQGEALLEQRGIDLVIALDVSRSMLAEDVAPSRAGAASTGLGEMLTHLTGNRVGLVTFAGSAFERAPLTVDLDVLRSLVVRAQAEAPLVQAGTNLDAAIEAALRVLDVPDRARTQAILVVSDGEDLESSLDAAVRRAEDAGVAVYAVFSGSTDPTALPASSGGTDTSTGQPETLARLSEATGGAFRDVRQTAGLAVEFRRLQQTQFASDTMPAPIDRATWFAAAALALIAAAIAVGERGRPRVPRLRGGVIAGLLVAVAAVGCGTATWRQMEEGNRQYAAGAYEDALASYLRAAEAAPDLPAIRYNLANTLHQLRRFEEAAASAQEALDVATEDGDLRMAGQAQYTLGNTAFRRSELEAARNAYRAVLRIDPDDRDAKANLELVLALLEPPVPPAEGEPGSEPGGGGGSPGATPEPDGTGEPGEPGGPDGETPSEGGEPGEGTTTDPPPDATLEEVQAALESTLGELGTTITPEEAARILRLAQRANELSQLPSRPGRDAPPR